MQRIAGKACDNKTPAVRVEKQDPQTLYYSGQAFARTYCEAESVWYQGCADVSWDPTGTKITYKIRWQEKITRPPPPEQDQLDIAKRCFHGKSVLEGWFSTDSIFITNRGNSDRPR